MFWDFLLAPITVSQQLFSVHYKIINANRGKLCVLSGSSNKIQYIEGLSKYIFIVYSLCMLLLWEIPGVDRRAAKLPCLIGNSPNTFLTPGHRPPPTYNHPELSRINHTYFGLRCISHVLGWTVKWAPKYLSITLPPSPTLETPVTESREGVKKNVYFTVRLIVSICEHFDPIFSFLNGKIPQIWLLMQKKHK